MSDETTEFQNPWLGPVKVRFGWQPVLPSIFEFVFIRANSWGRFR